MPVPDSTLFKNGGWYVIGGVGNAAKTASLVTQVQSIVNATTITVLPAPAVALVNAPIGNGNIHGTGLTPPATQFGPSAVQANAAQPYVAAGFMLPFDPTQATARNISVKASTAVSGTAAIIVTGYDIYGMAMSELITASGTTTIFGKKAFKYVAAITPQQTQTASFTIGIGDTFGFHTRTDKWEYTGASYNGVPSTNNAGFTAAVVSPATNTSGDVRGTLQLSANGALGTSALNVASNGTSRLFMNQDIPLWNMINASPNNPAPLFGPTQA